MTAAPIDSGQVTDEGSVWFKTWDEDVRFILPAGNADESDRLFDILKMSNESGRSVTITFDPYTARLAPDGSTLDLQICSVRLEEQSFTTKRSCTPRHVSNRQLAAAPVEAVALGWAEVRIGEEAAAIRHLTLALSAKGLTKPVETIARRTRATANDEAASDEVTAGHDADRFWAAALADNEKLAALRPDDVDARISEGLDYEHLGDYAAAEKVYRAALEQWPDEKFRLTIRLAAMARTKGDYERSLDLLNSLPQEFADQLGMKFYYHRGWTLTKLGRFDEAILDFTEGLKTQPDYPWAFIRRACAYAGAGRLDYAVSDLETAAGFLDELSFAHSGDETHAVLDVARRTIANLQAAIAEGKSTNMPDACDGFSRFDEKLRQPSPLLAAK
ncbi:MAG: tetratricopeptide repeat protein [Bacillota bacterium]